MRSSRKAVCGRDGIRTLRIPPAGDGRGLNGGKSIRASLFSRRREKGHGRVYCPGLFWYNNPVIE